MIDLHMHTKYSDGSDNVKEMLEKAEKYNLKYISITDHNTCKAYSELLNKDIRRYIFWKDNNWSRAKYESIRYSNRNIRI